MKILDNLTIPVLDSKTTKRKYPEARIVLDDNFNAFWKCGKLSYENHPGNKWKKIMVTYTRSW